MDTAKKKREPRYKINPNMRMKCDHFEVTWQMFAREFLAARAVPQHLCYENKTGVVQVVIGQDYASVCFMYSPHVDFTNLRLQCWLRHTLAHLIAQRARVVLPPRLDYWQEKYDLHPASMEVKPLPRNILGQCSRMGDLLFSPAILLYPLDLIDSVILHELAHLKYFDHSKQFWDYLTTLLGEESRIQKQILDQAIAALIPYQNWLFPKPRHKK